MLDNSLRRPRAAARWTVLRTGVDAWSTLQGLVVAAGLVFAILFIVVGLAWELQLYADGSIFAYSVAVQDSWAIHWHNISGRVAVYLATCLPAELYVALTGNARAGIALYGLLFFSVQLIGLVATYAADRSPRRLLFTAACLSTACLCPLVFGFPTEMWFAHALFWPALTLAHYARPTAGGLAAVLAVIVALVHTHGGGVIFAAAAVFTTLLRRPAFTFLRAAAALMIALLIWAAMQASFRPDEQISPVLMRAAMNFIDPRNLLKPVMGLLVVGAAGYVVLISLLRRADVARPDILGWAAIVAMLAAYWFAFDRSLLAEDRYFLRSALFFLTPALGVASVTVILQREGALLQVLAWMPRGSSLLKNPGIARVASGVLGIVLLVHVVETTKFIWGWTDYTEFVRNLSKADAHATAASSDHFVSSRRIPADLSEFSWSSTTHYLSVVAAPDLNPARLVINPDEGYHWITCQLAKRHSGPAAVPEKARKLVEAHACMHP